MAMHVHNSAKLRLIPDSIEALLERLPALAISGEESPVEQIFHDVLLFLTDQVKADIGQINLIARGGGGSRNSAWSKMACRG